MKPRPLTDVEGGATPVIRSVVAVGHYHLGKQKSVCDLADTFPLSL